MTTAEEKLEEFTEQHGVFLAMSHVIITRAMAQERLLTVVLSLLAKCLGEDSRRDLINELYRMSWPAQPPEGATAEERATYVDIVQGAEEYTRKLIDDAVAGLEGVHVR